MALHLDVVDWGTWRWSQEGGLVPDRRDLGAMEEQDEGSIGRSPNLSFKESESFFRLLCCLVLEKTC